MTGIALRSLMINIFIAVSATFIVAFIPMVIIHIARMKDEDS